MKLYEYARKAGKILKEKKKEQAGRYLFPVRRMEQFAPVKGQRVVAMTFDDGPMALPPNPVNGKYGHNESLTALLIEIMAAYGARGTFDIIGSTQENYPDHAGSLNTSKWGGTIHDHYPQFGKDEFAGAANQPALIDKLIAGGHELSNHSFRHVLFGPNKVVYGSRHHFKTLGEVAGDLRQLHELIESTHHYVMTFSRPPHYIDKIPDGYSSYDAYALLGYDYLAAGFDGGGWLPSTGDYQADIRKMTEPLEKVLKANPDAMNGQIIFQKDGYNMSLMTPIGHALEEHLKLLGDSGYRVVSAGELKRLSPFEDIDTGADYIEKLRHLDQKGYVIGYQNNTFKPDKPLTRGEMLTMTLTKKDYRDFLEKEVLGKGFHSQYKKCPYYPAYKKYGLLGQLDQNAGAVTADEVRKFLYESLHTEISLGSGKEVLRRDYISILPF
ncbi:MAG: polysaccharide deacetylase family protein [Clostridiales bacterium]|nr:polysaccharide deacetylase family protein [Clostridiales bacterium]